MVFFFRTLTTTALLLCAIRAQAEQWTLQPQEGGVAVMLDGQLFTKYLERYQNKPVLHPIVGPTGKAMTRPLGEGDHPHHASLWFTHGGVGGTDFWHKEGLIEHLQYVLQEGGDQALLKTKSAWHDAGGKLLGHEVRTTTFDVADGARQVDVDIQFTAADRDVVFAQTKEGSFGLRVWPTMTVKKGGGIVNSNGQTGGDAWGKPAAWVDYYGPIDGETLGIAILNHPDSLRFPTAWHVREYGLFAANPFMKEAYTLPAGETLTLRYRVLFHEGDTAAAGIAAAYKNYAGQSE